MFKNLAIKGGGVKGIAYVGALKVLENHHLLDGIERIAGTSAGSLIAGMLAVGHDADAIRKLMGTLDFKKFESGSNFFRIFSKYGYYSGNVILDFINTFIIASPLNLHRDITFKELQNAGGKDLYVFACNVNTHTKVEFSAFTSPNIKVAEAIRASMSIPFFFKAFQFSNDPEKHIYVDGGVVFNYPLTHFDNFKFNDKSLVNPDTLGLYLFAKQTKPARVLKNNTPLLYAKLLFESLMDAQDVMINDDAETLKRSVMIDDLNYPATDFNLSTADMQLLIESGSSAALNFIKNNNL